MILSTLCYIEKDNQVLMLHRTKKSIDPNGGKWIGVGGKLEQNESPDECIIREVYEETGLHIQPQLRGILTFILPKWENELTFLYTSNNFEGTLKECNEGQLHWIDKDKVIDLNLWEGDKHFLPKLLETNDFFTMKLVYDKEDQLLEVK
ncbi:MAG: 8-oxo-dGTP diphosphatase [Erysipelotrichaceae bacterium]|nr:8-oxo-dGTP diphosphatase [Erysipelotrichaceae bacterium]